jgi:hypothetical protein
VSSGKGFSTGWASFGSEPLQQRTKTIGLPQIPLGLTSRLRKLGESDLKIMFRTIRFDQASLHWTCLVHHSPDTFYLVLFENEQVWWVDRNQGVTKIQIFRHFFASVVPTEMYSDTHSHTNVVILIFVTLWAKTTPHCP